ncbi:hypothetical protein JTE90_014543 [Oedothorax gibbosus]|uniref:Uncharacterized protein n=1 Tax=Oedothorax gibbosus TaxID=931172 RepID=A0AAV6TCP5_9ARAC|nr:hypothetical protein JTE90_014543 [Oedothorax gibbosus]
MGEDSVSKKGLPLGHLESRNKCLPDPTYGGRGGPLTRLLCQNTQRDSARPCLHPPCAPLGITSVLVSSHIDFADLSRGKRFLHLVDFSPNGGSDTNAFYDARGPH